MTLRRLVLWRHGETDYNVTGHMQGHLDSVLSEAGWRQARAAVAPLTALHPALLLASDLRRAVDTASVFAQATGLPMRLDKRLRETNLGRWQGLTPAEVERGWPGGIARWRGDATWAPPDGETRVEVAARAAELVAEIDEQADGTALLCAHSGLIIGLTAQLLGLPVPLWPRLAGMGNCHWTVLTRLDHDGGGDPRWRLVAYNAGQPE